MTVQAVTLNLPETLYERAMLVRAQAAALLKQGGHDVSELVTAR